MEPDFLIIGTQKGGTTKLFKILSDHPEIYMPPIKEVHFFDKHYLKGSSWYTSLFENGKLSGEATPNYLFDPKVPERVYQMLPKVKLIILLRNPVDRAYSQYQMQKRKGVEQLTFKEALLKEKERTVTQSDIPISKQERYKQLFSYTSRSNYSEQIKRWLKYFNKNQMLILKSENLFNYPQKSADDICKFLNIQNLAKIDSTALNKGVYDSLDKETRVLLQRKFKSELQVLSKDLDINFNWF